MVRIPTTGEVRSRALDLGLYLPLGAYSRVRDEIASLNRPRIEELYQDLIERGQVRVEPIERAVRRRAAEAEGEARGTAGAVRGDVRSRGGRAKTTARKTQRKTAERAEAAAAQAIPTMPRVTAPTRASDLPIGGYDSLSANEIISRLNGLTQTDLARTYKYEKANEDRATILESVESRLVELPIPTYDALTVDEVGARIEGLTGAELETIRRYEESTKARATVLEKIDARLS